MILNQADVQVLQQALRALREHLPADSEHLAVQSARLLEQLSAYTWASEEQLLTARELHAVPSDNDIEIDDGAGTSQTDEGYWIEAWVWVRYKDDDDEEDIE